MIRQTLESYLECKKWLEKYESKRNYFISSLNGATIPGISYEEKPGGATMSEGMKKAYISDKLNEYDKRVRQEKKHCESVMGLSHKWINEIKNENRMVLIMVFVEGFTQDEAGSHMYWSRQKIGRAIETECEKIENTYF